MRGQQRRVVAALKGYGKTPLSGLAETGRFTRQSGPSKYSGAHVQKWSAGWSYSGLHTSSFCRSLASYQPSASDAPFHAIERTLRVEVAPSVSLHTVVAGVSNDKAIVCIPGALGTAVTDFAPQLLGLSSQFTVVAFDPRGYGDSRDVERDFNGNYFAQDAEDALSIMKSLGYGKFHVIGWSDGASASVHLAAKHPESVERLVLIGGNAYICEEDIEIYKSIADVNNWSKSMRAAMEEVYGDDLPKLWSDVVHSWERLFEEKNGDICASSLWEVRAKTLILHGEKDPLVPDFHPQYLHERILHSRLHVIPGGKHNIHIKHSQAVNAEISQFLSEKDDRETQSREFVAIPSKQ